MTAIIQAILPIAALIGAGWLMRRLGFPAVGFWRSVDRLLYFVLLPALLFRTMIGAEVAEAGLTGLAVGVLLPISVMTVVLVALRRVVARDGPAFSSVLQGAVRVNPYIGLAVASNLHGIEGLAAFTLVLAIAIPADNAISIFGLVRYAGARTGDRLHLLRVVLLNPLVVSTLAGMSLGALRISLTVPLDEALRLTGAAALPLALFAVGAGLDLGGKTCDYRACVISCVLRQVGMPLLVLGAAEVIDLEPLARWTLVLYASLSTGPAAYVVARQLGGDADLMAAIVSVSTLAAFVSVPLWLWVLG